MGQGQETNENWAQAWIDEQREKLKQAQAGGQTAGSQEGAAGTESGNPDLSLLMQQLGDDWRKLYERFVRAGLPSKGVPLGWGREYEQAWRDLLAAQAEYRKLEAEVLAKMMAVHTDALDRLERLIKTRSQENRPLANMRELYDLWVECGEQAYAGMAHSEGYCRLQAELANAAVRVRAKQQAILEQLLRQFDLPTRSELNSVHRELRALREQLAQLAQLKDDATAAATARRASVAKAARRSAAKDAGKKAQEKAKKKGRRS